MSIATISIPDLKFKEYLIKNFDFDKDGEISKTEALKIKKIYCKNLQINSLSGIEFFTNLEYLDCSKNDIIELDLSHNKALEYFKCNDNVHLQKINISKCSNLFYLSCIQTKLIELDICSNTKLKFLYCGSINLKSLNISNNVELQVLSCRYNNLDQIDVSKNVKLTELNIRHCGIYGELNLMNCPLIKSLDIRDNQISKILFDSNYNNLKIILK